MKTYRLHRRLHWLIPIIALLSVAAYMLWAQLVGVSGFPLDDAWIHRTYTRNLAESSQLA